MWKYKKQMQAASFIAVTLTALVGAQQALSFYQDSKPILSPSANIPDAEKVGDVAQAMEQSRRLLALLKEVDYDSNRLPLSDRQLPDHVYAEDEWVRLPYMSSYMSSYVFTNRKPEGSMPAADPKQDELVFYSPVYVRRNMTYYKGDKSRAKPTGFFIVGLKDGRVYQVPVADVRVVKGENGRMVRIFPGMKAYDSKAWRLPFVEFADGDMSLKKVAAFERDFVKDCPGCSK